MPDFTHCSSGCATGGHSSWGECVRAKDTGSMALGGTRPSLTEQKRFARDTALYREVVRAGGSLSTAMNQGVDVAIKKMGA